MRRWPLLANRDFMLLWSGEVLSELGSQASTVAYPLLVLALTGSAAQAGLVGLAKWLPLAIFAVPAGVLADRVDRKRLMIGCDPIRMLAAASIVIALIVGQPPFAQIFIAAFLDGALFICSYICERGALGQIVPREQLQDAVAQNEARTFAAGIVGPSLGGLLFSIGRSLPFIADTVSFLASMTAIAATRSRFQSDRNPTATRSWRRLGSELASGFTWLRRHPFFGTCAMLFAAGNPVFTGLYLLAILLARDHGASAATIGAMFAIVGAGGVLGALAAPTIRRRLSVHAVIACGDWLLFAVILGLLLAHNALLIGGLLAVAEFATPVTNAVVAGARIAATPDELQGRVQAASTMIAMSFGWLGPLAVGAISEHAGPITTISVVAGWTLLLAVAATTAPQLRHAPNPESAAIRPGA
jgi:predicted MFS family arabinose efflux permease